MSVFNFIKSLFGRNKDSKENKEVKISIKVEESEQTSSDNIIHENGVSGIKSSEPIRKSSNDEVKPPVEEVETSKVTNKKDLNDSVNESESEIEDSKNINNSHASSEENSDEEYDVDISSEDNVSNEESVNESEDSIKKESSKEIDEVKISVESEDNSEDDNEMDNERDNMTLLKDNDIYNMDDIDFDFKQRFIDAGLETVDHCFQCGTCGGGCPSGRRTPYRVRQVVRKCLLGLREDVISDPALWMCTTCYTCQERCPRSVEIVEVIKFARNEAAHAGYMADAHKATGKFVIESGHGVPINDKIKNLRKEIGLPEVPPTTHKYPEALKEIQEICKLCEFDKLIGYEGL